MDECTSAMAGAWAPASSANPPSQSSHNGTSPRAERNARYDQLVREMKEQFGIRVHRWRKRTTGCAWEVRYHDGRVSRLIESPLPRTPISAAVFLHEVGHHAIGFHRYKLRCLEEYMAWQWALRAMKKYDIPITEKVRLRVDQSLRYAVAKARRRGLQRIPEALKEYLNGSPVSPRTPKPSRSANGRPTASPARG